MTAQESANASGLKSKWPVSLDLTGGAVPCRLESEVGDLVVLGTIPKEIDGTFYRVMVDPYVPPHPQNIPLDGDGHISAFRFHDGKVDMKTKYVETDRYKLERRAGKALFGLYRNPFSHHPCVRAAVDSTANTNIILWAGQLLALKEGGLPYAMDPNTLETIKYDPFGQIKSKTFTAHPKYDPVKDELVVFGYEASGLASNDVVSYTLDHHGKASNEFWFKQPWDTPGAIHDCVITPNWLVLFIWPFEASIERMKRGGHHWAWNYDRGATFLVAPRDAKSPTKGWKAGEVRHFTWKNCMLIHTAAAWEDANGNIIMESTRVHDNAFPWFPSDDGQMPAPGTKADYVRWSLDPSQPSGSAVPDPEIVLDAPSEFPRIDERVMTKPYKWVFLNAWMPQKSDSSKNIFHGLNALVMINAETQKSTWFYAGDDSLVQEPVFVPRSEKEGDGWVIALIERLKIGRCDLVILDTTKFEEPVAFVQLPIRMKAQVHGNWVSAKQLGGHKSLIHDIPEFEFFRGGVFEPFPSQL